MKLVKLATENENVKDLIGDLLTGEVAEEKEAIEQLETKIKEAGYRVLLVDNDDRIKIDTDVTEDIIRAEDTLTGASVELEALMTTGFKYKLKSLKTPKKMSTDRRGKEITMYHDDKFDYKKEQDLVMFAHQAKEWSEKGKPSLNKLVDSKVMGLLIEPVIKELRRVNNLPLADEEEEKNE